MTNLDTIAANQSIPVTAAEVLAALNAATGSIDADLLTNAPTSREWEAVFFYGGPLAVQVGEGIYPLPNSGTPTITEVRIAVKVKPVGAGLVVDVNSVNASTGVATTLYTTQGNRPDVGAASGVFFSTETLPDITQPGVGGALSVDIDSVGSTNPGEDLTVVVRGTY